MSCTAQIRGNDMLYNIYETQKLIAKPISLYLKNLLGLINLYEKNLGENVFTNLVQASSELVYEFTKEYYKPKFDIDSILIDNKNYEVKIKQIIDKPFCNLIKFEKLDSGQVITHHNKPLLIVAPLSGHFSTLLRETVRTCLQDFDVYITDWKDAKTVPYNLLESSPLDFGFDDYVLYVKDFINFIKKDRQSVHILAVCQPTVPVLVSVALMAQEKESQPDSITLMGGPVDTSKSPTEVNNYAKKHSLQWFKNTVIDRVPFGHAGVGRPVYPGFLQYSGFVAMNFFRHTQTHLDFFNHLLKGSEYDKDAEKHKKFYDEYNAVMDLPAKYYLETLERVFLNQYLAEDKMFIEGKHVSLSEIKLPRLLTIEGEKDDISGIGQTMAAINLCSSIPKENKEYFLAKDVGHYGLFSGSKWNNNIYPKMREFALEFEKNEKEVKVVAKTTITPSAKKAVIKKKASEEIKKPLVKKTTSKKPSQNA